MFWSRNFLLPGTYRLFVTADGKNVIHSIAHLFKFVALFVDHQVLLVEENSPVLFAKSPATTHVLENFDGVFEPISRVIFFERYRIVRQGRKINDGSQFLIGELSGKHKRVVLIFT